MEDPSSQINYTTNNSNLGANSEHFVEDWLDDIDSTWDDLNSRITVSRMVSDSLIKGMVSAILDESNEKLASKEEKIERIIQDLQNCKMVQSELSDKELHEKKIEDLSVIKSQLRDLLQFIPVSELGVHLANNEQNSIFKVNSEECIKEIFSDLMKLDNMKNEDLIHYLKEEFTKMKRGHDLLLQEKTEEIFVLKREILKEKGSNPLQCENLRKKIYKLLNNLDEILLDNIKENQNDLLNEKIEEIRVLDNENLKLEDLILQKDKELEASRVFCLNLENDFGIENEIREMVQKIVFKERFEEYEIKIKDLLNEKSEKIRVLDNENGVLIDLISKIEKELEVAKHIGLNLKNDLGIENEIKDTVQKTVLKERFEEFEIKINEIFNEKTEKIMVLDNENGILIDITSKIEKELEEAKRFSLNLENEFIIEAEIREIVKKTVLKERFDEFEIKIKEQISQFNSTKECEFCLKNEVEREKLKQAVDSLSKLVQEKENFASEIESKFSQLNQNFNSLMQNFENKQDTFVSNSNREFNTISFEFESILVKTHEQEEELSELKRKFENILENLEEKEKLANKIDPNWVVLIKEFIDNLLKEINKTEWRLINNVDCAISRITPMKNQFEQFKKDAIFLKNEKEWYKNASEISKDNLHKAEIEVDMLGDEVDTLMYLLNKTYRVLKYYSYVFQHYPGVTEVLKLVEKYINGQGSKISWPDTESIGLLTPK